MPNKIQPISPDQALNVRIIPDLVFETFNQLISESYDGNSVIIKQKDVVSILEKQGLVKDEIFKKHWLDIEDAYREAGWDVEYDKPGFNETYDATFKFTRRVKK